MNRLWAVGWSFGLLLFGVLITPTPSEAAPTLFIDGAQVTNLTPISCSLYGDSGGYNQCYSIPSTPVTTEATRNNGRQVGNWRVGSVSAGNQARVLVNSQHTVGAVDKLKITGITLTPIVAGADTTVVLTNAFTDGSPAGLPRGVFMWGMTQNGATDPPGVNTANGNKFEHVANGTFPGQTAVNPMGRLVVGPIANAAAGANKSIFATQNAVTIKSDCFNSATGRCTPTVQVIYTITVGDSNDTLVLSDSLVEAFGTCRDGDDPPADVLDGGPPNQLPVGPVCRALENQINQVLHQDEMAGQRFAKGLTPPATAPDICTTACGTGTIVIRTQLVSGLYPSTTPPDGTFGFTTAGNNLQAFDITTVGNTGSRIFSNVDTGLAAGSRTIEEITFPTDPPAGYHWELNPRANGDNFLTDGVECTNTGGNNGTSWSLLPATGNLTGVTITNLADNDTLTCTFTNGLYPNIN